MVEEGSGRSYFGMPFHKARIFLFIKLMVPAKRSKAKGVAANNSVFFFHIFIYHPIKRLRYSSFFELKLPFFNSYTFYQIC